MDNWREDYDRIVQRAVGSFIPETPWLIFRPAVLGIRHGQLGWTRNWARLPEGFEIASYEAIEVVTWERIDKIAKHLPLLM